MTTQQKVGLVCAVLLLSINSLRHYGLQAVHGVLHLPHCWAMPSGQIHSAVFPDSLLLSEIATSLWGLLSSASALL